MLVVAHMLLMVGINQCLGFSVLPAGLTVGATAVKLTSEVRDRQRAIAALGTLASCLGTLVVLRDVFLQERKVAELLVDSGSHE